MKIEQIKTSRGKTEITFSGGEKITISKPVWEKTTYTHGMELTEREIKNLIEYDEIFLIKRSALRMIARREHARKELQTKLLKKGFSKKNVEAVLDILEHDNFLNDERFAELYVRQNLENRKKSPKIIRYELSQKGIDNLLIDKYLSGISEEDVYQNALLLAEKKLRYSSGKDLQKRMAAVRNHLLYKAYPNEIINKVLTEIKERLGA